MPRNDPRRWCVDNRDQGVQGTVRQKQSVIDSLRKIQYALDGSKHFTFQPPQTVSVAMTTRDVRFHPCGLAIEQLPSLDGSKFMTKSELRSCSRGAGPRWKREADAVDHWSLDTNEGIGIWESLVRASRWTVVLTLYFHVSGGSVRLDRSWAWSARSGEKFHLRSQHELRNVRVVDEPDDEVDSKLL